MAAARERREAAGGDSDSRRQPRPDAPGYLQVGCQGILSPHKLHVIQLNHTHAMADSHVVCSWRGVTLLTQSAG